MHRRSLAAQCFVVVAPAFPLTNNDVPGAWANAGDVTGQIGDVSFLIDEVLGDADLAPLVDPDRIGMIGHSLGGLTTAGAAIAPDADARISAAVVMSAGFVEARPDVAVMVLHGDADAVVPFYKAVFGYEIDTMPMPGGTYYLLKQDGVSRAPEVAAERDPEISVGEVEIDRCRAEDVAGTAPGGVHSWHDRHSVTE